MSDKLGVMVVGPGWVAGQHLMSYAKDPRTEIRVIAGMPGIDKDEAQAKAYMEQYGFEAECTTDDENALQRDDIDIVGVCTINFLHYEQTVAALEAGKNVLTEKPLCFTMDEVKRLAKLTNEKGATTHVGHVARYYSAVRGLWQMVHHKNMIGKVFYAESDYWHEIIGPWKVVPKTGGSSLLMGGCHSVDMVRWMIGEDREIDEVFGYTVPKHWRDDFEYDPTIALLMKYKDGAVGKVACSLECNMPYVFHIQVLGTEGTVRNNGICSEQVMDRHECKGWMSVPGMYMDDWDVAQHPFPTEVEYFVDCVEQKKESELSFPHALKTYEVIFAAEESAKTGKPVKLPL